MKKTYRLLFLLGVAASSLSSCSRASYSFNNSSSGYLGSQQQQTTVTTDATPPTDRSTETSLPTIEATTTHRTVRPLRHVATARIVTHARLETAEIAERVPLLKRKAIRQELKQQLTSAPKEAGVTDKSQTVALVLCILLGGIGVHQFYLGYTGRGILRIALALTSFLIVPAIVNLVLYILDIIKIANGTLEPRDGQYGKKFNK